MLPWVAALGSTLLMQSVASFLTQSVPVIAPLVTARAGLAPEAVGNLSALIAAGTALFLLLGGPLLTRLGPVRTLQWGAVVSAAAMLLLGVGSTPALVAASLLLGIGYGPSPPAGSRILAATAPPQHRTLIFSVKQAGAPLGGALAGLVTAPAVNAFGWVAGILVTVAVALLAALVIQPLKESLDAERDPRQPIGLGAILHRKTWAAPVAALRLHPSLPPLTALAMSFAAVQGCLFTFSVTWLNLSHGLTLVQAGTAFASMQAAGVFARLLLGWLADRTGRPVRNLLIQALAAAAVTLGFAWMPAGTPVLAINLLAGATGFLAASWNGIYLSEVARLVPPAQVASATAGSTLFTFLGYLVAPAGFTLLVALSGSWVLPLTLVAAQLALVSLLVSALLRSRPAGNPA